MGQLGPSLQLTTESGADPGFFLRGSAPLSEMPTSGELESGDPLFPPAPPDKYGNA